MRFPQPLLAATLQRRYKRFLVDCILADGNEVTCHCANTGAMTGLNLPGMPVLLSFHDQKSRQFPFSLELVDDHSSWVGVNTSLANQVVAEALTLRTIEPLHPWPTWRREVPFLDKNRLDFLLTGSDKKNCFLEVKSVTLRTGRSARFPDAITQRGVRHLHALSIAVDQGFEAMILYLVQRDDCTHFSPAADIDPLYADALRRAIAHGVQALSVSCRVTPEEITVSDVLPMEFPGS
ncbi:MAG: DNA/RNA nuclease SfsA [Magnetococcales bacterium]|nr:DNA/RNA nuclease SfsA [Magnetococcales bacterium]